MIRLTRGGLDGVEYAGLLALRYVHVRLAYSGDPAEGAALHCRP